MTARYQIPKLSGKANYSGEFDVVVCGGGPAGVAAAIAATREGVKVLLVEQAGYLGGSATQSLVGVWLGSFTRDHKERVVAGIFKEIVNLLVAEGAAIRAEDDVISGSRHVGYGAIHGAAVPFMFEPCKRVLEKLALREGVNIRYFTTFLLPKINHNRIEGLFLHGKSGISYVKTSAVVDATGDADVAFRSGCPTVKGRKEDGLMTPATLIFVVEDADSKMVESYCKKTGDVRFRRITQKLEKAGKWPFPSRNINLCEMPLRGSFFVNTLCQYGVDGTDEKSLTEGIIAQRAQVNILMDILRKHIPGFRAARLALTAPSIGIRETRRIVGRYVLKIKDMMAGKHFRDTIALTGFGWDLQDPQKPSYQPMFGKKFTLPYSEIPYRSLVPQNMENLIVAGRCISVEREALGPVRVQPVCFATGQAAGISAAWVARKKSSFAALNTDNLRKRLVKNGAIVSSKAKLDTKLVASWIKLHNEETGEAFQRPD